jgi:hypothetical protein
VEARTDRIVAKVARGDGEPDGSMEATGLFFFERAEKEHEAAERKREATLTKATAIAALAAALAAIVAAPALDASGLAHGVARWLLLIAVACFLTAVGCIAGAILIHVRPGERVDLDELDNWLTEEFWLTDVVIHAFDLTQGFVKATVGLREANDAAEKWITRATAAIAGGLVMLLLAFVVETV